jgi:hypothetical protein
LIASHSVTFIKASSGTTRDFHLTPLALRPVSIFTVDTGNSLPLVSADWKAFFNDFEQVKKFILGKVCVTLCLFSRLPRFLNRGLLLDGLLLGGLLLLRRRDGCVRVRGVRLESKLPRRMG